MKQLLMPSPPYRPDTFINERKVEYLFTGGGIGDYICWTPALLWLSQNHPFLKGRIWASPFVLDLLNLIFRDTSWRAHNIAFLNREAGEDSHLFAPMVPEFGQQLLNATGAHLTDCGFAYFCNLTPPPSEADLLPHLTFPKNSLPDPLQNKRYVVLTPGATAEVRTLPAWAWNKFAGHCEERGLLPVWLGKEKLSLGHEALFSGDIDLSRGINLVNKTSLISAAAIMEHAVCVVGLDNGLLHLASCTNATVVFGYNIAGPRQRRPRRKWGRLIELYLTQEQLSCANCQEGMKQHPTHRFDKCFYGDMKCIDLLLEGEGHKWTKAIDVADAIAGLEKR